MLKSARKIIFIMSLLAVLLTAVSVSSFAAPSAAAEVNAVRVSVEKDTLYRYYGAPTAIAADNDALFAADGTALLKTDIGDPSEQITVTSFPQAPQKIVRYGDRVFALCDGTVYVTTYPSQTYPAACSAVSDDGGYQDIFASDAKLYAVKGKTLYSFDISAGSFPVSAITEFTGDKNLKKITVHNSSVYASVSNSLYVMRDDILMLTPADGGNWVCKTAIDAVGQIDELISLGTERGLATLSAGKLMLLHPTGDGFTEGIQTDGIALISACANAQSVYALTGQKGIVTYPFTLSSSKTVIASAHDGDGFFFAPTGVSARRGQIAVADELNNRVALIGDGSVSYISNGIYRPKAAVSDYNGNYFIAHSRHKIGVYSADNNLKYEINAQDNALPVLFTDLKMNSVNDLFALSLDGNLYCVKADTQTLELILSDVRAMDVFPAGDKLTYVKTNGKTYIYGSDTEICDVSGNIPDNMLVDMFADQDNALFFINTTGTIFRYAGGMTESYSVKGTVSVGAITMNTVSHSGLKYGDVLIADTTAHAVVRVNGTDIGVNRNFTVDTDAPDIPDAEQPTPAGDNRIIFVLEQTADVYPQEAEINGLTTLSEGMKIIIPEFDEDKKFNFVVADNLLDKDGDAITGYVYTSMIRTPALEYTTEHPESCYNWKSDVPIYKYPTRNSPLLKDYKQLKQNTRLLLKDFVYESPSAGKIEYGLQDNFANVITWYRVGFGSENQYEGYVTSDYISVRGGSLDQAVYPRTNAVIIAKDSSNPLPALTYEKNEDGTFTPIGDLPLIDLGTKVEVIGAFDSSEPYTQIKYYMTPYGTLTVWVETANLKYEGINLVQVMAIIISVLTAVLAIGIICRAVYVKRTRKAKDLKP